jgi:propionyl-CoA carboxylase beta chain
LAEAEDPVQRRDELASEYRKAFANPYQAASLGFIDAILRPENTRARLIDAFDALENKRDTNPPKKHGNIPL